MIVAFLKSRFEPGTIWDVPSQHWRLRDQLTHMLVVPQVVAQHPLREGVGRVDGVRLDKDVGHHLEAHLHADG